MNKLEEYFKNVWCARTTYFDKETDETDEALMADTESNVNTGNSSDSRPTIRFHQPMTVQRVLSILLTFICIPIIFYVLLLLLSNNSAFIPAKIKQTHYNLLLVVAHPDDESLFFSPTLRVLQRRYNVDINLLVFSHGNHAGLGDIRAKELHGSCQTLKISEERCISLDLPNVQDNPKVWWSEEKLIPILNEYIYKWSIDILVSFDHNGVSGHINHRAVGSAVNTLIQSKNNTRIKMSYQLKSVSLLRKYSSIFDFYFTFISFIPRLIRSLLSCVIPFKLISMPDSSRMLLINTPSDYFVSRAAFANHQTQFSWDRYLYLIASRYMFINELKYIDKQD